jgi:hypothetical protein
MKQLSTLNIFNERLLIIMQIRKGLWYNIAEVEEMYPHRPPGNITMNIEGKIIFCAAFIGTLIFCTWLVLKAGAML